MDAKLDRLQAHPETARLRSRRRWLTLLFPTVLGGAFFTLVLLAGFSPEIFDNPWFGGAAALGTVVAVAFLVLCLVFNALYMLIYNAQLESLRERILRESES